MDGGTVFRIGVADGDHISLTPMRRKYPEFSDYWDGNWMEVAIDVRVGGFQGHVNADLRAEEFFRFREALRTVYERLDGNAVFETMEHWITIRVVGDGRGHFEATCELRDDLGSANRLTVLLVFDQTEIPAMVTGLDGIIKAFPVVGRP